MAEQAEKELGERRGRRRKGEEDEDTGEEGREERAKQRELMKVYSPPPHHLLAIPYYSKDMILNEFNNDKNSRIKFKKFLFFIGSPQK